MADNIFGVNVGQVQPPSGGRNVGGGLSSSAGASLNQLMRFQQRMYEIEQQKKMQETANKNALFGDLAKKIGVGAKDSKDFLGIEPMNMHQANLLSGIQKDIQDQMTALSNSDGSTKNYSQSVKNIKTILSSPDFLEAGITNQVIKGAIKGIEENKANVHPLWQDELAKFQNAQSSGEYDVRVLQNWKDYAVEKMDIENDLKAFDEKGISVKAIVSPISGQELLVTSQDNKDYIGRYFKGKYSKNFGLDYDRAVKNGDESIGAMTREDYINSQTSKLTDAFVTQEESQKMSNTGISIDEYNRRSKLDRESAIKQREETNKLDIEKARQEGEIDIYVSNEKNKGKVFAEKDPRSESDSKSSSAVGRKNPYEGDAQTGMAIVWDNLANDGVITPSNELKIKDYISTEAKEEKLKDLSPEQREIKLKGISDAGRYKFATPLSNTIVERSKQNKGKSGEGKDLNIRLLTNGENISLNEYAEKEGSKSRKLTTKPAPKGYKGVLGLEFKEVTEGNYKTRFIPEGEMSNSEYSGSVYTDNPTLYKSEGDNLSPVEVTGLEANKAIGDNVFSDNAKVYKIPSAVNKREMAGIVPTSFNTVTQSKADSVAGKNNNPGNIRIPGSMKFKTYSSLEEGFDAMVKEIDLKKGDSPAIKANKKLRKRENEVTTLADLIETWSPREKIGGDNSDLVVDNYIKTVSEFLGIKPDTPLKDVDTRELSLAMAMVESPEVGKEIAEIVEKNQPTKEEGYVKKGKPINPARF